VLSKISVSKTDDISEQFGISDNEELYHIYQLPDIVMTVKCRRLQQCRGGMRTDFVG